MDKLFILNIGVEWLIPLDRVTCEVLSDSWSSGRSVWAPKMESFFDVDSQKWWSFSGQNAISSQTLQILCRDHRKIGAFLIIRMKCAKICNLYVKFDAKVKKVGHWVWAEKKKTSMGVRSAVKAQSIDRPLISTDIWECPRVFRPWNPRRFNLTLVLALQFGR